MKFRSVFPIFISILIIECLANLFGILWLQFFSKPLLMLMLLVYFADESTNLNPLKNLIIGALTFSWFGDVFLLLDKIYDFLFIYGLSAFLLAHIFYAVYFWKVGKFNRKKFRFRKALLISIIAYSVLFYIYLYPTLSDLKIPVFLYCSVISLMVIACLHAFDFTKTFAAICLAGTLLFALSDSILAINRFVFSIPVGRALVMLFYGIGQLLITEGSLRNLRVLKMESSGL